MVDTSEKPNTKRTSVATGMLRFSNTTIIPLIRANLMKKGDVLGVARVAGIGGAKKCSDLIPLCHVINLASVKVEIELNEEEAAAIITTYVSCVGATGVEMEALTAVTTAALTVYDMCKAVDKGMRIEGIRVVSKTGGSSSSLYT